MSHGWHPFDWKAFLLRNIDLFNISVPVSLRVTVFLGLVLMFLFVFQVVGYKFFFKYLFSVLFFVFLICCSNYALGSAFQQVVCHVHYSWKTFQSHFSSKCPDVLITFSVWPVCSHCQKIRTISDLSLSFPSVFSFRTVLSTREGIYI